MSKKKQKKPESTQPPQSFGAVTREWTDTLVFAFILAMFIRTFVVELFRIPSGSMSPTLIGDYIFEYDLDQNNEDEIIINPLNKGPFFQIFLKKDGIYHAHQRPILNQSERMQLQTQLEKESKIKGIRFDRICVNKLTYLFSGPKRGDIAVFKTPETEHNLPNNFNPDRPIFVKRTCVLPGEEFWIEDYDFQNKQDQGGRLRIDGEIVSEPNIFENRRYTKYSESHFLKDRIYYKKIEYTKEPYKVPEDNYMMFGDNTWNSSDSRMWGPVPGINFKGKAFLRYWPLMGSGKLSNFGLIEQNYSILRWILFILYLIAIYFIVNKYSEFDQKWKQSLAGNPPTQT